MNESIESIVTEMRERADAMQTHGTTHGVRLAVLEFARRIEAAWEREKAEIEADALAVGGIVEAAQTAEKSSAVGNSAAMRDALLNIQEYAAAMDVDDGNVLAILDACRDALAAPARNCDRFAIYSDAAEYWHENIECADVNGCFDVWLFEPAAERKGVIHE